MVLLTGAGLLFRTFVAMVQVDPGFETEQLVVLPLAPDADRTDDERLSFTQELIGKITALPGTRSVTAGATLPFTYTGRSRCCWRTTVTGDPAFVDEDNPFLSIVHPVTQDYFTTLDAPITIGRDFERADMESGVPVAILNRRTAEALFGTENVVGRTINIGDDVLTVVGINEGVHHWGLSQDVEQAVYVPYGPIGPSFSRLNLAIRTDSDLEALAPALRETVWSIDPTLPISGITTMDDRVSVSLASPRFLSGLLAAFAAVALLLACGGIYGSMLYTVGQRTREIGIRLALGAEGPAVMGLVLRDGIVLSVTGIVLGTMAALSLGRVMESLVWGVEPNDPITLGGVALVLCTTALFASFLPAWKAARTDPMEALRAE